MVRQIKTLGCQGGNPANSYDSTGSQTKNRVADFLQRVGREFMHPVAMQITEIIPEAFHAALVLTGSVEGAERTLIDATARIASDGSREAFLAETARAAATHEAVPDKSPLLIPRELQALFLLPTTCRYCFVLLVLLRFDLETCSQILNLSADDVKEALDQSLLDLPKVQSAMCRAGIN